jgi:GT2 family glycosyltransferase
MAVFKNVTQHPINIILNGRRRTVKPNDVVHGPESLAAIVGLQMISKTFKTVIPNKEIPQKNIPVPKQTKQKTVSTSFNKTTDLKSIIDEEIKYLEFFANKQTNPSVTIAILTKNHPELITDCCESIFNKVHYPNTTILIADTGTTDETTKKYYKKLPNKCQEKGFNYKYVQLPKYHFSQNYNDVVFNFVKTDYVIIQNNDTKAVNDYVTEMMRLAVLKKVGSVGCRMFYPNMTIQHDGQHIFNMSGALSNPGHLHLRQKKQQILTRENRIKQVDGNTAAGVLIRTDYFKSVGGFETQYGDIFQDVDLMLKIPNKLGKFNYCNRQAEIIHLDNASRLGKGADPELIKQMHKDSALLHGRAAKNGWLRKLPKTVEFSIVTLVNDIHVYRNFTTSLKQQDGEHSVEVIAIPNFHNIFNGCGKGLNTALDISSGKYVIFCHQDIIVPKDWLIRLKRAIQSLETDNIKWGVIGPAGVTLNSVPYYYLLDGKGERLHTPQNPRNDVFCLDELCMVIKKENNLRFRDEHISGYHFYGLDICSDAKKKGLRNFAVNAWCHHSSVDGKGNLKTKEKYDQYLQEAKNAHKYLRTQGISEWRTTTALGKDRRIIFWLTPPDYPGEYYVIEVK